MERRERQAARAPGERPVASTLSSAWIEQLYADKRNADLSDKDVIAIFQAGLWGNDASRRAMSILAQRWHYFDPYLATPEAVQKRRCFMEILILSGMWHPDGADVIFEATTQPVKKGWVDRMFTRLTHVFARTHQDGRTKRQQ
jgi:hypothetical protein